MHVELLCLTVYLGVWPLQSSQLLLHWTSRHHDHVLQMYDILCTYRYNMISLDQPHQQHARHDLSWWLRFFFGFCDRATYRVLATGSLCPRAFRAGADAGSAADVVAVACYRCTVVVGEPVSAELVMMCPGSTARIRFSSVLHPMPLFRYFCCQMSFPS